VPPARLPQGEEFIASWDAAAENPWVRVSDCAVVTDSAAGDAIVATAALFSHTWSYDGLPFNTGVLDAVVTEPRYRQRGLMRSVLDVLHRLSAAKGHSVQAVYGARWLYRRFGYEYALAGEGIRHLSLSNVSRS